MGAGQEALEEGDRLVSEPAAAARERNVQERERESESEREERKRSEREIVNSNERKGSERERERGGTWMRAAITAMSVCGRVCGCGRECARTATQSDRNMSRRR